LNSAQRALAERVHGLGEDFHKTMKMLRDPKGNNSNDGIQITRIFVLNPDYVKETLNGSNAQSFALGSFLEDFEANSSFDSIDNFVGNYDGRLRGVPSSYVARVSALIGSYLKSKA
jgi:hypothetical protein